MPYPWRTPRCHICHDIALPTQIDGESYCVRHMPSDEKIDYNELANEQCSYLVGEFGRKEYVKHLDARFPGPDDMVIDAKERYEWAKAELCAIDSKKTLPTAHNIMTWEQSEHLRIQHQCSDCWDDIHAERIDEDVYLVKCNTPGCTTPGFVSRSTIKFRSRQSDEFQYWAIKALKSAQPWMNFSEFELDQIIKGSNDMTTPRQAVSFPDVAIIHKGTPKQIIEKDGRKIEIQGKDLNSKFRIHFLPGTETVRADWHKKHAEEYKKYGDKFAIPDGYEVESLRVVIPAPSVWDAWDYGNEVYNAGRRIALADDDHYISLRDPVTGEFTIKDGKPFREFKPKDKVNYERKGKKYSLEMKTHGRLRLVLEDLVTAGHLVQVILKTTSFYDCQNIKKQLAGIQAIADSVNGGNAGGIPLLIYRAEQEVAWNHDDGSASRIKKWFINIKADPRWVQAAFARLGKNALEGTITQYLTAPVPLAIEGPVNPENETFESGDEEPQPDFIDATAQDIPPEPEPVPPELTKDPVQAINGPVPPSVQLPLERTPEPPREETRYAILGDIVVKTVSRQANISMSEAARAIGAAKKGGRLQNTISLREAEEFASTIHQ